LVFHSIGPSLERNRWSDFTTLLPQLPTTLTSLTLNARNMHPGWLSDLPDLPHLTLLHVVEDVALTNDPSHVLEGYITLSEVLPLVDGCSRLFWAFLKLVVSSRLLLSFAGSV